MSSRVVRVYDGEFPSIDEIRFGDPAMRPPFPDEVWPRRMQPNEVALFCVNFKSQTPVREETGRPGPQSEETCRIFASVEDAEAYAQGIVKAHPTTVCILRSNNEMELKRISNSRFLSRSTFVSLLGLAFWFMAVTMTVLSMIWFSRVLTHSPRFEWILWLSAWQWFALIALSALLGISVVIFKFTVPAYRRVIRFRQALENELTPEEKTRFRQINALSTSPDPEDRNKAKQLHEEYLRRVSEIRQRVK